MQNNLDNLLGILGGTFDPIHLGHLQIIHNVAQQIHLSAIKIIPCYQSPHRPHPPIANAQHRSAMIKLALEEYANQYHQLNLKCELDEREINKSQISYSVNTLEELHREQEQRQTSEQQKSKVNANVPVANDISDFDTDRAKGYPLYSFCLILGADAFAKFHLWHQWQKILQLCHLIVATRLQINSDLNSENHVTVPLSLNSFSLPSEFKQAIHLRVVAHPSELKKQSAGLIWFAAIKPIDIAATTIRENIKNGKNVSQFLPVSVWQYIVKHNLYR